MAGDDHASPSRVWRSAVSEVTPDRVVVRGYPLEELIGLPFTVTTFLMIRGRLPSPAETKVLDAVLTGVLDYGLEKSGTAAARFVVSCNPNMQAGIATAALAAGKHGLATEEAARYITQIHDRYRASGDGDLDRFAAGAVEEARRNKARIPGFGHPVFEYIDPRAQALRSIAEGAGFWTSAARVYDAVHRAFTSLPGREHFPMNDVGVLAAITVAMGFTPEESTALAVLGTLPGVVAHISEELASGARVRVIPRQMVDYQVPSRSLPEDLQAAGWQPGTLRTSAPGPHG